MARTQRPRWRVNVQSFVGHALVNEGDEVYYTPTEGGAVSDNLTPLNDEAQEIVDAQKDDHADKTANAAKRAKAGRVATEEAEITEKESLDGLVPKSQRKGETKKVRKPAGAGKDAPATDADGEDDDAGDVG